jgi:glucose-6-phosphate 1-epimerase
MESLDQLNSRFAIPGVVKFESGSGGLTRAVISASQGDAHVYLHGAHVTHYQPAKAQPLLFLSSKSEFTPQKSIRGGMPICFPWFSSGKDGKAPIFHGFVRTMEWKVDSATKTDDAVKLTLSLKSEEKTRAIWPFDFQLRYTVTVGSKLNLALEVTNTGSQPIEFEEALHTYFPVADIARAQVTGLENTEYLDKVQANKKVPQGKTPVTFAGETDRIYLGTRGTCIIHDPAGNQTITVAKNASNETVVWNPWIAKAKTMTDLGDGEWTRMLCIETCNVKDSAITLQPGQSHTMSATISGEAVSK